MTRLKREPKFLHYQFWPRPDQEAWAIAVADGDMFDGRGAAANWSPRTRETVLHGYGRWLAFLRQHQPARLNVPLGSRVTPSTVGAYVEILQSTSRRTGPFVFVRALYDAMRVMEPSKDWTWLKDLKQRLGRGARPASKADRIVHPRRLAKLGLHLMDTTQDVSTAPALERAIHYRDGLLIALLACHPRLRRRNLSEIRISANLIELDDGYALRFRSKETKNRTAIDEKVDSALTPYLDTYLDEIRPQFPGAADHEMLWPSRKGGPLTAWAIYQRVTMRTRRAFGMPVNLHTFRHCAVTAISRDDPKMIMVAPELLGHKSFTTTDKHYIVKARQNDATHRYHEILQDLQHELDRNHSRRRN